MTENPIPLEDAPLVGLTRGARLAVAAAIVIPIAMCITQLALVGWPHSREEWSQFGDSYGGIGALFSGVAFAGVVAALWMQQEELRRQAQELSQQRKDSEAQADQLQSQQFETSFFNLLDAFQQVVAASSMRLSASQMDTWTGRQVS